MSRLVTSLSHFNFYFYFEQFTLLELDLYLVTLGCKPKLEIVQYDIGFFFVTN